MSFCRHESLRYVNCGYESTIFSLLIPLILCNQEKMTWLINFWKGLVRQKQPPEMLCKKVVLLKISKFHRKTPVLESPFNKVQAFRPVEFRKFSSTPILKKLCERLLLMMTVPIILRFADRGTVTRYKMSARQNDRIRKY